MDPWVATVKASSIVTGCKAAALALHEKTVLLTMVYVVRNDARANDSVTGQS